MRASSGVAWNAWARYLTRGAARRASGVAGGGRAGRKIAAGAERVGAAIARGSAAAIVDWVTENIEATDELAAPGRVHAGARRAAAG